MKQTFILLSVLTLSITMQAQKNVTSKKDNLKVNLFSPVVKSGSFFYERKLSSNTSAQLGGGFTSYNKDEVEINGWSVTPEFRFYLSENKEAMQGFYIAPFARYQNLNVVDKSNSTTSKGSIDTYGGGLLIGNQWLFKNVITLDAFIGPSYNYGKMKVTTPDQPDFPFGFKGFGVRTGVTLGVSF